MERGDIDMLIQFSVRNFLCFYDEQVFNLISGQNSDNSIKVNKDINVVRGAVIFGANASGKSSLLKCIDFAKTLIVDGVKSGKKIQVKPFKLSTKSINEPSKFEFTLSVNKSIYNYGFLVNSDKVLEEWLYLIVDGKEVPVFERVHNDKKIDVEIYEELAQQGTTLYDRCRLVTENIGEKQQNQLLLSKFYENNIDYIAPIYNWFENIVIIYPDTRYDVLEVTSYQDKKFNNFLSRFLHSLDTNVEKVMTKKTKFDLDNLFWDIPEGLKEKIDEAVSKVNENNILTFGNEKRRYLVIRENGELYAIKLMTKHISVEGDSVNFEFYDESDGTQRLFDLIPSLYDMYNDDKVYFIDEMDRSLHTLLVEELLRFFYKKLSKRHKSQLIFTTHDTNIMNLDFLSNDQIWFIEKDINKASKLTSLYDFQTDDIEVVKSYLSGRFGGIPIIKRITPQNLISEVKENGEDI